MKNFFENNGGRKTVIFFVVLILFTIGYLYLSYKISDADKLIQLFETYATKVLLAVTALIVGNLGEHQIKSVSK